MKYFFEEIKPIEEVHVMIMQNTSDSTEHSELLSLARSSVHHKVLDLILSEVPDQYKENLLQIISEEQDNNKIIERLKVIIDNFENKVEKAVHEAQKEIIDLLSSN